jgi:hypothetical protein
MAMDSAGCAADEDRRETKSFSGGQAVRINGNEKAIPG